MIILTIPATALTWIKGGEEGLEPLGGGSVGRELDGGEELNGRRVGGGLGEGWGTLWVKAALVGV